MCDGFGFASLILHIFIYEIINKTRNLERERNGIWDGESVDAIIIDRRDTNLYMCGIQQQLQQVILIASIINALFLLVKRGRNLRMFANRKNIYE